MAEYRSTIIIETVNISLKLHIYKLINNLIINDPDFTHIYLT